MPTNTADRYAIAGKMAANSDPLDQVAGRDWLKVTGYRGGARTREVFLDLCFFVNSSWWLLHTDSLLLADGKHIPVCKHSKFHLPA